MKLKEANEKTYRETLRAAEKRVRDFEEERARGGARAEELRKRLAELEAEE